MLQVSDCICDLTTAQVTFDNLVDLANEAFNALVASHQCPLWNAARAIIVDGKWSAQISVCNERSAFSIHAFASIASAFKTYMAQEGGGPPPLLPISLIGAPSFPCLLSCLLPLPVHVLLGNSTLRRCGNAWALQARSISYPKTLTPPSLPNPLVAVKPLLPCSSQLCLTLGPSQTNGLAAGAWTSILLLISGKCCFS